MGVRQRVGSGSCVEQRAGVDHPIGGRGRAVEGMGARGEPREVPLRSHWDGSRVGGLDR
jgi:hypothetical protein